MLQFVFKIHYEQKGLSHSVTNNEMEKAYYILPLWLQCTGNPLLYHYNILHVKQITANYFKLHMNKKLKNKIKK